MVDDYNGVQVGAGNFTGDFKGFQIGGINHADDSKGIQAGVINNSFYSAGLQFGGINSVTRKMRGVQLSSLLNICEKDSVGVQVALLNWRRGNPWYSAFVPLIAIRRNK